jgi:hypothetical protein
MLLLKELRPCLGSILTAAVKQRSYLGTTAAAAAVVGLAVLLVAGGSTVWVAQALRELSLSQMNRQQQQQQQQQQQHQQQQQRLPAAAAAALAVGQVDQLGPRMP